MNLCGRRDSRNGKKKKRRKKWHRYCARAHTYTHIQHTPPLHTPEACRAAGSRRFVDSSCSFARAPFPKHHFFRQIRASLHPRFSWVTGGYRSYNPSRRSYIYTERERARKYGLTGNRWKEGKDGWTRGAIDREALICDTQRCCDYIQNFSHL